MFLGWYSISLSLNACRALCMCLLFVVFLCQLQWSCFSHQKKKKEKKRGNWKYLPFNAPIQTRGGLRKKNWTKGFGSHSLLHKFLLFLFFNFNFLIFFQFYCRLSFCVSRRQFYLHTGVQSFWNLNKSPHRDQWRNQEFRLRGQD